ncbi:MAG TPA: DUF1289 domain-containing protein [Rhizomicrobium sp.]|nr:DUF1289 domain-containing protein [Rhizomicrobium sp.]
MAPISAIWTATNSASSRSDDVIQSPCIKVCTMDPVARICTGCGRTLDEIARWGSMSDAERAKVRQELQNRLSSRTARSAPIRDPR